MFLKKIYGIDKIIKTNIFFLFVLAVVVFSLYGKSIKYGFTYGDDNTLIKRNINYISDINNVPKFFLDPCLISYDSKYYRPLLILSFAIEAVFFRDNPAVYHLADLFLFVFALYLIYLFCEKIISNKKFLKMAVILTAVHPMFASCAVHIPSRNDTILVIFVILSLIFFIKWLTDKKIKNFILYISFFIAALFTKETAVVMPVIYFLFVYCFEYKITKKQAVSNIILLLITLAFYLFMRNVSLTSDLSVLSVLKDINIYLENIFSGIVVYINQLLFPYNISIMVCRHKFKLYEFLLPVIILILTIIVYIKADNCDRKKVIFSLLCTFLFLLPTFLQYDYIVLTHRVLIVMPFILIIFFITLKIFIPLNFKIKKYALPFFLLLVVVCSCYAYYRADKFANKFIYAQNLPDNSFKFYTLGCVYNELGKYDKSEYFLNEAYKLNQNLYIYVELAVSEFGKGDISDAEQKFLKIIEVDNENAKSLYYLSKIYSIKGDDKKIFEYAYKAYKYAPYNTEYMEYFVEILAKFGKYEEAIKILTKLIKLDRKNFSYYYNLSLLYNVSGNKKEAAKYCKKALIFDKNNKVYSAFLEQLNRQI